MCRLLYKNIHSFLYPSFSSEGSTKCLTVCLFICLFVGLSGWFIWEKSSKCPGQVDSPSHLRCTYSYLTAVFLDWCQESHMDTERTSKLHTERTLVAQTEILIQASLAVRRHCAKLSFMLFLRVFEKSRTRSRQMMVMPSSATISLFEGFNIYALLWLADL